MSNCRALFRPLVVLLTSAVIMNTGTFAQSALAGQLAELTSLKDKVRDADTRTRVGAFHRVWTIALASDNSDVKISALSLISEPLGSSSDHIRMPAIYAVAEIANSTADQQVKLKAMDVLRGPMQAGQLPIRIAAIDALNSIVPPNASAELGLTALKLLREPVRSINNGVRIPAINAIGQTVSRSNSDSVRNAALDLLVAPLDSEAMIGGMEVRMMALVALERIGLGATEVVTKAKAMGLLQSYANKSGWEPEAKKRASDAASKIQNSLKGM